MQAYKMLKIKAIILSLFLMGHFSIAQDNDMAQLKIVLTGFKEIKGEARVLLFDKPEGYPGTRNSALDLVAAKVESSQVMVSFENLKIGKTYSIAVYHDENENKNFDSNFLGIPIEGYGTSNNVNVYRSPTFEETSFVLEEDGQTLNIKIHHLF